VQIWDDAKQVVVTSLEFNAPIQRVRISQTHLVVVLLNNVSIYAMKIPPKKVASYETVNNPFGLCCLSKGLVAFPGITEGQVKLFHLKTKTLSIIPAHNSSLRALGLSQNEDMVATASKQGTIIRLWAVPSCTKITEFRRGVDTAIILSLAFSGSGRLLAATSDKSTLHIFDVPYASESETSPQTHKWGLLSKVPMLPRQFSDTYALMSIKFELGDDPVGDATSRSGSLNAIIPGIPGGRPTKGLAGWINDDTLILIGAGQDARWEKFIIGVDEEGRRVIGREGWKKYLE
jgi:WD40 repeat protein